MTRIFKTCGWGLVVWLCFSPTTSVAQQTPQPAASTQRLLGPLGQELPLGRIGTQDIFKTVEKIRHPVKRHPQKPDRHQVTDAFYQAEFLSDSILYYQHEVPKTLSRRSFDGKGRQSNTQITGSLEFKLKSIQMGSGQSLWTSEESPSPIQIQANTVTYQRTPIVSEVYEAREGALEQSWVFGENPSPDSNPSSDLIIEGSLLTQLLSRRGQNGDIEFVDEQGEYTLSYGRVFVQDANGNTLEIDPVYDPVSQTVVIQVPGSWLVQAAYPVVIDPFIGSTLAISTAAIGQGWVQIGYDGTNFLVVWEDYRNYSLVNEFGYCTACLDIYGARIRASDGVVLDPNGIAIATGYGTQGSPAIAYGGGNYLVVWQDNYDNIYGARVRASDGVVLDSSGIAISTAYLAQGGPFVSSDGTNFLVVWHDRRNNYQEVYGAKVRSLDGVVLDSAGNPVTDIDAAAILISNPSIWASWPNVTFDGTNYLVVWAESGIKGRMVSASGSPQGSVLTVSATGSDPALAYGSGNYLVAWLDYRNGADAYIYGSRVSTAGTVLDTNGILIANTQNSRANPPTNNQPYPAVGFDGISFLTGWHDYRNGSTADIYGARVKPADGSVIDINNPTDPNDNGFAISVVPGNQHFPTLAYDSTRSRYLVVWSDKRDYYSNVYGVFVGPSDAPIVYTDPASAITQNSAALNGRVNPQGYSGTAWFEYGTGTNYGLRSNTVTISGVTGNPVNIGVNTLLSNTTYHYRLVASNNGGISYGADNVFTTAAYACSTTDPTLKAYYCMDVPDGQPLAAMTGMRGLWHFDSGLGATDDSGYRNHGTYNNGVAFTNAGKFIYARSFDGINDYISVPANASLNSATFTVEGWFKPNALRVQGIITKGSGTQNRWRIFMNNTSGNIEFDKYPGEIGNLVSTSRAVVGQWMHFAAVYDSSTQTARLYINGSLERTVTGITDMGGTANNPIYMGSDGLAAYFSGTIDEMAFYNTALSAPTILDHYNRGIARDSSGNGNTGTTWGPTSVPSKSGLNQALFFDSIDDYVSLLAQPAVSIAFTIETWVNFGSANFGNYQTIFNNNKFFLRKNNSTEGNRFSVFVTLSNNSIEPRASSITVPVAGIWYHVAATWNGTTLQLYVNGNLEGTSTRSGTLTLTTVQAQIGRGHPRSEIEIGGIPL